MPKFGPRVLGKLAKLGQMAVMQHCKKSPACTQRIAVHIAATKARKGFSMRRSTEKISRAPHTSKTDGRIRSIHPKDRSNHDGVRHMIISTDLPS
jgi:hypothetical protein